MNKRVWVIPGILLGLAVAQGAVTVWTPWSGPELEWLEAQAASYERAAGVTVEVVRVPPEELEQRFIQEAPRGRAADLLVAIPHTWVGEMARAGVLEPLDAFVTEAYLTDLEAVALEAFRFEGRRFGLPLGAEAVALIYNTDLVPTPPQDWEAFLNTARAHTRGLTFGFLYDLKDPYLNYGWFRAFGARVFVRNPDGRASGVVALGGEAGYRAARFIKALRYTYGLIPKGVDGAVADGTFKDGALAMILSGPRAVEEYRRAGIRFGVTFLPAPPGAPEGWAPFVNVEGVGLNAFSEDKVAAINLAKRLVRPEAQVGFYRSGGRIPVSKGALERLANDPVVQGFAAVIARGEPVPNLPGMQRVWALWEEALARIVQDPESRVEPVIDRLVSGIRSTIREP